MRAGFLLVLLLSAALVSQSEGGWWKRLWQHVKDVVKKVVSHVRVNCTYGSGSGVKCGLSRGKRDASNVTDAESKDWMDTMCHKLEANPLLDQGFSFDLIKDIFEEVDGKTSADGGDDVLDNEEYAEFMKSMEVFHYCLSKSD